MLEEKLIKALEEAEIEINLNKTRSKLKKKELRQLEKIKENIKYIDDERVKNDKEKITKEIIELKVEEHKLKKILYRLNVCLSILKYEDI